MKLNTLILASAGAALMALTITPASASFCTRHSSCVKTGSHHASHRTVWRKKRVVLRRAHTSRYYEPATYRTVKQRLTVRPARTLIRFRPPVYKWKSRRVKVRSAHRHCVTYRSRRHNGCVRRYVNRPAVYAWRKYRVLVRGPVAYKIHKPAEYINRTVHVRVTRGRYHRVKVPAIYGWRKVRVRVRAN